MVAAGETTLAEVDARLEDPLALSRQRPEWSCNVPLTRSQKGVLIGLAVLLILGSLLRPMGTARVFILATTVFYLCFTFYKLMLLRYSISSRSEITISPADLEALSDEALPIYSVLVPMYGEPESVPCIVEALRAMDYPPDKLDVQLLLEADDEPTCQAAEAVDMPKGFRVTLIPESFPRTKPKACNLGLYLATGEFLVIYDAEDRPEPDQLRKAVAAFHRVGDEVACLQSRLNFYNPRQNLLTRWFTAEYSSWFDLSLPGLCAIGAVIPLGGTSNHFVTRYLRDLWGWDAYNVTEDCDLGVRIYRAGYVSRMLNTTTWEEACSSFPFWIRQRTRWLKGYIQTYFVHMRSPLRLWKDLGTWNFLNFQLLIGGIVFSFLINPLFWLMATLWFVFRLQVLTNLFPLPVFAMGTFCLFAGNFAFVYTLAAGCYNRGYHDLVKYALLSPVCWVLMSVSGWRAFLQFFSNPFHWEKTQHGLIPSVERAVPGEESS